MLRGEKVILREYKEEDLNKLVNIMNEDQYKQFVSSRIPYPFMYKDIEEDFNKISGYKDYFDFAIESIDDNKYIGECGVKTVDWKNRKTEIYIFLSSDAVGKGYGTEATQMLLDFIFDQMNLHKVKLTVFSFNERAIKSYQKCGFKTEGVLKEELFKNGEYHDLVIMGLLKDEYIRLRD